MYRQVSACLINSWVSTASNCSSETSTLAVNRRIAGIEHTNFSNRYAGLFGQGDCLRDVYLWHSNTEFLTTITTHQSDLLEVVTDHSRDVSQHLVTDMVPVGIVYTLEVVNVDHQA